MFNVGKECGLCLFIHLQIHMKPEKFTLFQRESFNIKNSLWKNHILLISKWALKEYLKYFENVHLLPMFVNICKLINILIFYSKTPSNATPSYLLFRKLTTFQIIMYILLVSESFPFPHLKFQCLWFGMPFAMISTFFSFIVYLL